jgi:response regulator of citrate/malate metabolism
MALSSTDIDNLKEAIASGVLTVSQNGKTLTYRSLNEMKAALAFAELEVNGASRLAKRVTVSRPTRRRR